MFFLAFIPYVGNFIACGAGMLLTLAMESPGRALAICILFCVIQALDGYFLYPRVIGMKVNMPPLLIFVSVIAGGNLFGVAGVFLSIPVVTAVYTIVGEKIKEHEKQNGKIELYKEVLEESKPDNKTLENKQKQNNYKNKKTRR
jgi:predicted PurR-regulated permease PerM